MRQFTQSKWFYRILALFFALLLFFNANSSFKTNDSNTAVENAETYTQTVSNVPIEVKGLPSDYFATLDQSDVSVTLSSQNKVILNSEVNAKTRKFKVVVNLSNRSIGTHDVPIELEGLNSAINGKVSTKKVQVTISKKATKTVNIQTNVKNSWVSSGHQIQNITVSPKTVTVTGSQSDIKQLDHVVAVAEKPDSGLSETTTLSGALVAYATNGDTLDVNFSVKNVEITVTISSPKKSVPINLMQTGTLPNGVDSYQFLCDTQTVTLHGSSSALAQVKSIDAYVDITNITSTETKRVLLSLPDGVTADTKNVSVTIVPQKSESSSTNKVTESTKSTES